MPTVLLSGLTSLTNDLYCTLLYISVEIPEPYLLSFCDFSDVALMQVIV